MFEDFSVCKTDQHPSDQHRDFPAHYEAIVLGYALVDHIHMMMSLNEWQKPSSLISQRSPHSTAIVLKAGNQISKLVSELFPDTSITLGATLDVECNKPCA